MIHYTIPGKPIPASRPRVTRFATFDKNFKAKKQIKIELQILCLRQGLLNPLQGPIFCHMTFYTPIPKSVSKSKKMALIGTSDIRKTGDIDNLFKFYADLMNDLVYHDDSQIVAMSAEIMYSDDPRTEITIGEYTHEMATEFRGRLLRRCGAS